MLSQLSNFRDLLKKVEQEYILLLQDKHDDDAQSFSSAGAYEDIPDDIPKEIEPIKQQCSPELPEKRQSMPFELDGRFDPVLTTQESDHQSIPRVSFSAPLQPIEVDVESFSAPLKIFEVDVEDNHGFEASCDTTAGRSGRPSLNTSASEDTSLRTSVFPIWWNPDGEALKQLSIASNITIRETHERAADPEFARQKSKRADWVFSPVSFPKLHWDFLGYILILYVVWAMPFQVVFGTDNFLPDWMKYVDTAITVFFSLDVFLNFNTGFIVNGDLITNRCAIVRRYSEGWFLVDLLTCIPFDMLDSKFTTHGRLLQVLKGLKPVRYIRLVQTMMSLQSSDNAYFSIVTKRRRWLQNAALLVICLWKVHLLSCVCLALQPAEWKGARFSEALREYFDVFVEVCMAVLSGSRLRGQTVSMQFLELFIGVERVFCIFWLFLYALREYGFHMLNSGHGESDRILQYLGRRRIDVKTQVEVFHALKDMKRVRAFHGDLSEISDVSMPQELQQKIKVELWHAKLRGMGLIHMISCWNDDFVYSLALCCQEELLPTSTILFNLADTASATWNVLAGEFKVISPLLDDTISNFSVGMWLGEDALVNPALRRGLKAEAVCLSSVMAVPSSAFHGLLLDLDLSERFEHWVSQALWRGMCGRCGKIGQHFQDKCPSIFKPSMVARGRSTTRGRRNQSTMSTNSFNTEDDDSGLAELHQYLRVQDAWHLRSYLVEMGVFTLCDLQDLDLDEFHIYLSKQNPPITLTRRQARMLTNKYVEKFQASLRKGVSSENVNNHFIFLSHYKSEAGTEAALMLRDIEQLIGEDELHVANKYTNPIFLDSENLTNLVDLQKHVRDSMNVVLLLSAGVLSRPWCLVELVTASQHEIPVSLVLVDKPGSKSFEFPGEGFYADLVAGKTLNEEAKQLLDGCGFTLDMVESTLRDCFQNIALPYSPHRSLNIRQAELQGLLANCSSGPSQSFAPLGSVVSVANGGTYGKFSPAQSSGRFGTLGKWGKSPTRTF